MVVFHLLKLVLKVVILLVILKDGLQEVINHRHIQLEQCHLVQCLLEIMEA